MKLLIDFIEDRITPSDFLAEFYQDEELQAALEEETDIAPYATRTRNLCLFILEADASNMRSVIALKDAIGMYLSKKGVAFKYSDKPSENLAVFLSAIPKWLNPPPELFSSIFDNETLSNIEKKEQIKLQIKRDFRYLKKPPKWIQNPEWIIKDGKPLVFIGQLEMDVEIFHDMGAVYVFLDVDTGEIETKKQFY